MSHRDTLFCSSKERSRSQKNQLRSCQTCLFQGFNEAWLPNLIQEKEKNRRAKELPFNLEL